MGNVCFIKLEISNVWIIPYRDDLMEFSFAIDIIKTRKLVTIIIWHWTHRQCFTAVLNKSVLN